MKSKAVVTGIFLYLLIVQSSFAAVLFEDKFDNTTLMDITKWRISAPGSGDTMNIHDGVLELTGSKTSGSGLHMDTGLPSNPHTFDFSGTSPIMAEFRVKYIGNPANLSASEWGFSSADGKTLVKYIYNSSLRSGAWCAAVRDGSLYQGGWPAISKTGYNFQKFNTCAIAYNPANPRVYSFRVNGVELAKITNSGTSIHALPLNLVVQSNLHYVVDWLKVSDTIADTTDGNITGIVYGTDGTTPLADAVVTTTGAAAVTDTNGYYMLSVSPGDYTVTVDAPGLGSRVAAVHVDNFAEVTQIFSFSSQITKSTAANYLKNGWNLISLPAPPQNPDAAMVFYGLNVGGMSLQKWNNASQTGGEYLIYNQSWNGIMSVGEAYWFMGGSGKTINYTAIPNDAGEKVVSIPAHATAPNWIMIGHPLEIPVPCENVRFRINTTEKSWADAVSAGWIEAALQGFDASSQSYFAVGLPSNPGVQKNFLEPWYGYWMLVKAPQKLDILFNPVNEIDITSVGKASSAFLLDINSSWIDAHSVVELGSLIKKISGADIPVYYSMTGVPAGIKNLIVIGRPETNTLTNQLQTNGYIKLSSDYPGGDGFIIKSLKASKLSGISLNTGIENLIVLGGSSDRATLYAAYDIPEKYWNVGYFKDGDRYTANQNLTLPDVDVVEKPYFKVRANIGGGGCASAYSFGGFWRFNEWKKELDWMAKNRMNEPMLGFGSNAVCNAMNSKLGLPISSLGSYDIFMDGEYKKIWDYALSLGMEPVTGIPYTAVSDTFRAKYPNSHYFQTGWLQENPQWHIYPDDPLYQKMITLYIQAYTAKFGTGHKYDTDPYPEQNYINLTEAQKEEIRVGFSTAVVAGIRAADPQGVWVPSGWAYLDKTFWNQGALQRHLDAIPDDSACIMDLWCDKNPIYNTDQGRYFYGKEWEFGILHSFGGDDYLHGDIPGIINKLKSVAADPQAAKCMGIDLTPEVWGYDTIYWDLVTKLGWDPKPITVDGFARDFARRRYDDDTILADAVRELITCVYNARGTSEARYQHRLSVGALTNQLSPDESIKLAGDLKNILNKMLTQKNAQRYNPAYNKDILEITRQYLTELHNAALTSIDSAYLGNDTAGFNSAVNAANLLFDNKEKMLLMDSSYLVKTVWDWASHLPSLPYDPSDSIFNGGLTFAIITSTALLDYPSKDLYELVKWYYRKRFDAYISALRAHMAAGNNTNPADELAPTYKNIEVGWVNNNPCKTLVVTKPYACAADAVTAILASIDGDSNVQSVISTYQPRTAIVNGGFEDSYKNWQFSVTPSAKFNFTSSYFKGAHALHFEFVNDNVMKAFTARQTVLVGTNPVLRWSYKLESFTPTANGSIRVECFDDTGAMKIQAVYYWGGDNWDWGTAKPFDTGGFYAFKKKLNSALNTWISAVQNLKSDTDGIHGTGTWDSCHIKKVAVSVGGWAYEQNGNNVSSTVDEISVNNN